MKTLAIWFFGILLAAYMTCFVGLCLTMALSFLRDEIRKRKK